MVGNVRLAFGRNNFRKSSKIFENLLKVVGNLRKIVKTSPSVCLNKRQCVDIVTISFSEKRFLCNCSGLPSTLVVPKPFLGNTQCSLEATCRTTNGIRLKWIEISARWWSLSINSEVNPPHQDLSSDLTLIDSSTLEVWIRACLAGSRLPETLTDA